MHFSKAFAPFIAEARNQFQPKVRERERERKNCDDRTGLFFYDDDGLKIKISTKS